MGIVIIIMCKKHNNVLIWLLEKSQFPLCSIESVILDKKALSVRTLLQQEMRSDCAYTLVSQVQKNNTDQVLPGLHGGVL